MKTVISVKIDKDVRNRARFLANKIGLPLSTIVNYQLKQFADARKIEFAEPLIPNARTKKILNEALRDIKNGNIKKFSPAFSDMNKMNEYLKAL